MNQSTSHALRHCWLHHRLGIVHSRRHLRRSQEEKSHCHCEWPDVYHPNPRTLGGTSMLLSGQLLSLAAAVGYSIANQSCIHTLRILKCCVVGTLRCAENELWYKIIIAFKMNIQPPHTFHPLLVDYFLSYKNNSYSNRNWRKLKEKSFYFL